MGIKSLTYLIKEKSPDSIQSVNLYTLKNKRVAIDTSIFLYKSLINCRYNGDYIRNNEGKITLLENEGKARILAKPRIKAIDREEAEIFIGDELPYIELATDPSGRVQESVKYVDSGIHLRVKPFININTQEIRIEIEPEVSYVNGFKGSNNDIPIVRKRRVNTTVFVKNGQTCIVRLIVENPICIETFKNNSQMGRFNIRSLYMSSFMSLIGFI